MLKLWYEEEKDRYKVYLGDTFYTYWNKKDYRFPFEVDITPDLMEDFCKKINNGDAYITFSTPEQIFFFDLSNPKDNKKVEDLIKNHLGSQFSGDTL